MNAINKTLTIIAAMGRNRAIGHEGGMPWHLPGELQHFKRVTMGKPIIMGRKTWESIGRALPGRQNIVISRDGAYSAPGCEVVTSLQDAIERARGMELMIIGGGQLYERALPLADRMILTMVDCEPEADTWFPEWDARHWKETARRSRAADERNRIGYEVVELQRLS
jgi:dihydrofolate reductase